MYDHLLGGQCGYASDRRACADLLGLAPRLRELALINRDFLGRAVRHLTGQHEVRRYLDHGSGIPHRPHVHEIAREARPDTHVVYIDNDPVALGQSRLILAEDPTAATVLSADIRDTPGILRHPRVTRLFEAALPVGALFGWVLECIPDDEDPWALVRGVTGRLPSGSYLVISHLTHEDPNVRAEVGGFLRQTLGRQWGNVRSRHEVARFFSGLNMVGQDAPGDVAHWHPGHPSTSCAQDTGDGWVQFGGVARVP
ncbi:SAM-dependent methyltransferase [Streptomyces sp. NBC_00536]|uniref:SAM-dependent methyltransferase n=1 Tax=Streptomyces sp. NBC_00536 TaxID=2975769 RepID=UPI002E80427F|nr:SAM-dependent methyltransferase [Streptomyces sp. NBC_00536]WUC84050.1 SAM-dependent methyltransferase [Streptomyces sp. NBC_00536]